jgi:hypothetical protein
MFNIKIKELDMSNKIYKKFILLVFASLFLLTSCDLVDPTEVNNPAITEEKLFEDATGGAEPLLTGLDFAFSDAIGKMTLFTEVVSDNYENTSTYISTQLDNPRAITPNDQYLGDSREIYFKLQTLHALADFGLKVILPADAEATNDNMAVVKFYKAMAIIMLCENFQAFPLEENKEMIRSEDAISIAITNLNEAYSLNESGSISENIKLALARAYRLSGNKTEAVQAANEALAMDPSYIFYAQYDPINLTNNMNTFTVLRNQQDLQPLPRLDFLDPKYPNRDGSDPVAVLKTEEAYLILAEAALTDGDLTGTKTQLKALVDLVATRTTLEFNDNDGRSNRPNNSGYFVKADQSSTAISGLIFERSGRTVNTHPVSATSITKEMLDEINDVQEMYRTLYLMRQEIFFAEGRRMSDLGIRLPVMAREIDANPTVHDGDYGTSVYVPSYIPSSNEMDQFSIDETQGVVTILHDMNKIIAQNIDQVSPF